MVDDAPPEMDRRKVRMGPASITVVVVAALVLAALIESPVAKAVMTAVVLVGFVRLWLLTRSMRNLPPG